MKKAKNYKSNLQNLAKPTKIRLEEIYNTEREAIANYAGPLQELESAIGMLHMGDHVGWRTLLIIHNKRTIRKYEEILNIDVREFFPEEGPSANRSIGYTLAKKIGNYWKIVSGDVKVESRKEIS